MMNLENYLLFVGASLVLILVPGPDMIYLLARSINNGRKAGLVAALGINLGGYVHLTAAVLGLSAILATSALAFTVIKWAGALYLIYIGIAALTRRSGPLQIEASQSDRRKLDGNALRSIFWQGFISDVLNPKVAIFFLALLPQFVVTSAQHHTRQLIILGLTSNILAIIINAAIVWLSARITQRLRENTRIGAWLNNAMGAIFIGLGIKLAGEKL